MSFLDRPSPKIRLQIRLVVCREVTEKTMKLNRSIRAAGYVVQNCNGTTSRTTFGSGNLDSKEESLAKRYVCSEDIDYSQEGLWTWK